NERIYEQLSPAQRAQLHQAYERFKNMPPEQQQALRKQWHRLKPAQRKHWIQNGAKGDLPHARSGGH
ncbi:MAG TPA: DUF3106 domain-containing protein, partial [Oleiagrimonas sp.]|nr:DUF3106 domain-containing protein [Oleiagrimonas sp.]